MVLGRGFEPLILAVKGQCPRPLDEPSIYFFLMNK